MRISALAREAVATAEAALAVLIPPQCVVCGANLRIFERWLCGRCGLLISMSAKPRGKAVELEGHGYLPVFYGLQYTPPVSRLVWEMKYAGKPGLAEFLARFVLLGAGGILSPGRQDRVLVPVPIHALKRRDRGYNQAEVLSRHLSSASGIPVAARALAKSRSTPSQTTLERDRRLTNVVGSFRAGDRAAICGRSVILVDDVVTTGSTMRECALALIEGGAGGVVACAAASSG